jgi:glycosyltransferase involved in cell wall biosynthesis
MTRSSTRTRDRSWSFANRTMPEIAHFIAYTGTAMGGPVQSMAAYAHFLARAGRSVTVFSAVKRSDGDSIQFDTRVKLVQCSTSEYGPLRYSGALHRQAMAAHIDLVHSHGLWTDTHRLAGNIARTRRLPHLLAPCGMLAPGALAHHRWRKKMTLVWFQDRILREAHCLHAKSRKEYEDIRKFGLGNPIAIIANPISAPPESNLTSETEFRDFCKIPPNTKILLFLGRLHPIKGLPRLIRAWALAGEPPRDWTLVLAGPDEGGHRREIVSLAAELDCQDSIVFTGELDGARKWAGLRAAGLFVMPSNFENFGNSIVEALACGVPVITTTGTPWQELPTAGAGWCVEPTVEFLAGALQEALALSDAQRRQMGRRALEIAARFRPEQTGADLLAVYEWLLGKCERPGCVMEN